MCVSCFGVVVCCAVSSCVVLVLVFGAGVGVQCVVCGCGVCGVCVCAWCVLCVRRGVCCVWRGLARGKNPPCVGSKRIGVYRQNARMLNTSACFANTHGDVLNLHTGGSSSPSLFLSSFLLSLFLRTFLFLFLWLSSLLSSPLSSDDNVTRPVGSLSLQNTALSCLRARLPWAVAHSLPGEHVRIMHETTVLA